MTEIGAAVRVQVEAVRPDLDDATSDGLLHVTMTVTTDGRVLSEAWLRWKSGNTDRAPQWVKARIPHDILERWTDHQLAGLAGAKAWEAGYTPETWELDPGKRCAVVMNHPDGSGARCVLSQGHQEDDSDHIDEHGHWGPVLVTPAPLRELRAPEAYDRRQAERERAREQADAVLSALSAWDEAATAAHGGAALAKPLLTAAWLIEAGDKLAELLREARGLDRI